MRVLWIKKWNMEEQFKNKLENYKVDWNKEELLDKLNKELHPKRNIFRKGWLFLFGFICIATCFTWNYIDKSEDDSNLTQVEDKSVRNNESLSKSTIGNLGQEESQISEQKENERINESTFEQDQNVEKITDAQIKGNGELDLEVNKPIEASYSTNQLKEQSKQVAHTENVEEEKKRVSLKLESSTPIVRKEISTNNPLHQPINYSDGVATSKQIAEDGKIESGPFSAAADTFNEEGGLKNVGPFSLLPKLGLEGFKRSDAKYEIPLSALTDTLIRYKSNYSRSQFYLLAFTDIGTSYRARRFNTENPELVSSLESNESTERAFMSYTVSTYLGFKHKSGLSLQSGVEFNEVNEIFRYEELKTENVIGSIIRYPIITNMDSVFVVDTVELIRTEERTIRHFNKYRYYTIPLQFGYQFELKKARFISSIGLSYTFAHSVEGRINLVGVEESNFIY